MTHEQTSQPQQQQSESQQQQAPAAEQQQKPSPFKNILVTGAAGQTGYAVVQQLRKHETFNVLAAVPPPGLDTSAGSMESKTTLGTAKKASKDFSGCNVVHCDCSSAEACCAATKQADACVLITTSHGDKVQHAKNLIDACKAAGTIKYIVLISMVLADQEEYEWAKQFHQIEKYLQQQATSSSGAKEAAASSSSAGSSTQLQQQQSQAKPGGIDFTILRTNFYMQNFLLYDDQLRERNELPLPIQQGKMSPMDTSDIGRLVAHILSTGHEQHAGKIYNMTGPESLDGAQMAEAASRGLGRPIKFSDVAPEEARRILAAKQLPEIELESLLDYYAKVVSSTLNVISYDTSNLTGEPSLTLEQFFAKHKAELEPSKAEAAKQ